MEVFQGQTATLPTKTLSGYDSARLFRSKVTSAEDPRASSDEPAQAGVSSGRSLTLETTAELLDLAKAGDSAAIDALFGRCMPALRRWARGRLPRYARDLLDTEDLVQETVIRALKKIDSFEPRHEGALHAYLRQAILNRIRDEIRRVGRHPAAVPLDEHHPDRGASPLELAIGHQNVERYEAALQRLSSIHREAIVGRIELQYSYEQLAIALGRPTANAARSLVVRALYRLFRELRDAT